jgi:transcriptional regulator with XRE-family HTH domain
MISFYLHPSNLFDCMREYIEKFRPLSSEKINDRLKIWREYKKLTQSKLGEVIGLKWYQVKDMESGKVKISPKIEKLLYSHTDISEVWMRTGEGPMCRERTGVDSEQSSPTYGDPELEGIVKKLRFIYTESNEDEKSLIYAYICRLYDKRTILKGELTGEGSEGRFPAGSKEKERKSA